MRNSKIKSTLLNLKHQIKKTIKLSYNNYIEYILGIREQNGEPDESSSKFNPKKLFSLIKNAKQDA